MATTTYGEKPVWAPTRPRIRPIRLVVAWVLSTASLLVAAWIVPGAHVKNFGGAFLAAAVIAVLNAILPPLDRRAAAAAHARRSGSCSSSCSTR